MSRVIASIMRGLWRARPARRIGLIALGAWVTLMVPAAWAQVSTASLNGTVQDNTGASIVGAKVVALQTQTNFTTDTVSGADGAFRILSIPVGPYMVKVSKDGFSTYEQSGIALTVGQVATLRILLNVGSVTESVIVTAEAPAVENTSSTIQSVVARESVIDLPLNGRNPSDLLLTVPGVMQADLNPQATVQNSTIKTSEDFQQEASVSGNGARPSGTYFSLDGAGNVDPLEVLGGLFPNPDATQEFSVVIGSYGARYVSAPGGAVNIVTRSGTNEIHGSVFEFIRNGFFNARQFLSPAPDTLKRNQYGFAAGGPVLKDKLFAFGSWQYTDIREPQTLFDFVGTSAMQSGQFETASGNTVTLPIDPVAAKVLKYLPAPNAAAPGSSTLGYFSAVLPNPSTEPQWIARIDDNLGQERFFARYFGDRYTDPTREMSNDNFLTAQGGVRKTWDSYALGDTWASKSGGWIIDGRASLLKVRYTSEIVKSLEALSAKNLGIANISEPAIPQFPSFCCDLSLLGPSIDTQPRASWDANLDVIHLLGRHELSFGSNDRWISLNRQGDQFEEPVMLFYGIYSGIFYGPLNDNSYADFILGHPYVFYQADGASQFTRGRLFGVYAEDKYRLSQRFTLSGGVRWDPFLPYTVPYGHISCWSPGVQSRAFPNAPLGLEFPGDPACTSSGAATAHPLLIQPRLGIAYKIDQQGNTALRAGFGLYSTQLGLNTMNGLSSPPFNRVFELFNPMQSADDPWGSNGLSDPFAGGFAGPSYQPPGNVSFAVPEASGFNIATLAGTLRPGYVEQWTLSLQHAFTPSDSAELAYVGTEGVHLSQTLDANVPVYGPGATVANEQKRRPYGGEGLDQIRTLESDSNSSYNGVNATFRHRGKAGINAVTGFNWSRCLDDGTTPAVTFDITVDADNPRLRHGRCDFDQKISFRNTFIWTAPGLGAEGRFRRTAFGSWMVSALVTADAGQPTSVTDSADNSMTGIGLDLADRVPGVPVYRARGALNPDAFQINAPGTYGNSGRNSFNTPKYVDMDAAVMKTFPLVGERVQWTFRAEAFNVFNHTNLVPAQPDFNQPGGFGIFTGAHPQRVIQFAARITF